MAKSWRSLSWTAAQRSTLLSLPKGERLTGRAYWFKTASTELVLEVLDGKAVAVGNKSATSGDPQLNAGGIIQEVWHGEAGIRFIEMDLVSSSDIFKEGLVVQGWTSSNITGTLFVEIAS